jgi:hypothetical protein
MKSIGDSWDTLVLPVTRASFRDLIERLWPKLVTRLAELRDIDVAGPSDEAWFHVRRTHPPGGVEVLRLKRGILADQERESIRLLGESVNAGSQTVWRPEKFQEHVDNAFLSFLQKLSVLRARDGVQYPRLLARKPESSYDTDADCQEAYKVMMCRTSPWYASLSPWFDYMAFTHMASIRTHEYAHWFGHIISGWAYAE